VNVELTKLRSSETS